jgi:hypothetical protein
MRRTATVLPLGSTSKEQSRTSPPPRLAGDARWRSVAAYALASGIVIVVLFIVFGALAEQPGAPLHPRMGLFQLVLVAVWFSCTVVLSLELLRVGTVLLRAQRSVKLLGSRVCVLRGPGLPSAN